MCVSPLSIGPTFPKVRRSLAHICQIQWNLISFDDGNDEKSLNKRSYTEKNLSIYSKTIHATFILCGSFQLIVVVPRFCRNLVVVPISRYSLFRGSFIFLKTGCAGRTLLPLLFIRRLFQTTFCPITNVDCLNLKFSGLLK